MILTSMNPQSRDQLTRTVNAWQSFKRREISDEEYQILYWYFRYSGIDRLEGK